MSELIPIRDNIVVKKIEDEAKTKTGLVLPDGAVERPTKGEVIAVGDGKLTDDGTVLPMVVKKGDTVVFPKYTGHPIKVNAEEYLILKEDEVLLRAGKYQGTLVPTKFPSSNDKRSYLQLSYFKQREVKGQSYSSFDALTQVQSVKKLIEWDIYNPENTSNMFRGVINLYNVIPSPETNTENFYIYSDIQSFLSAPIYQFNFFDSPLEEVIIKINEVIKGVNNGIININIPPIDVDGNPNPPHIMFDAADSFVVTGEIFPFVFRPGPITYQNMNSNSSSISFSSLTEVMKSVTLNGSDPSGFGKVYNKDKTTPNVDLKERKETEKNYIDSPISYATLGGDKVYILSNEGNGIPGKGIINLTDTIYGIPQPTFISEIDEKTNSIVRGEELLKFLNLVSKFLIAHVHPFPGLPPVPVAMDGTTTEQILSELLNAPNKILNQNIRVNWYL